MPRTFFPDYINYVRPNLPMDAGKLRDQVTIQTKLVTGQDSLGQDEYTWSTVYQAYARVEPLQGRELETMQQRWAEARYKVVLNALAGIERAMRAIWWDGSANRVLNILDVQDTSNAWHGRTVLICKELAE